MAAEMELGYLRSPPALSVGPHMEKQPSGPLGTDVCSPMDSSPVSHRGCAGTWPTHDNLQPQVIHTWNRRERTLLIGWNTNKQTARKSTPSLMLTRPACSEHVTTAQQRSSGTTLTQILIHTSLINPRVHTKLQHNLWFSTNVWFLWYQPWFFRSGEHGVGKKKKHFWHSLKTVQQLTHTYGRQQCCLAIEEAWALQQEAVQFRMAQNCLWTRNRPPTATREVPTLNKSIRLRSKSQKVAEISSPIDALQIFLTLLNKKVWQAKQKTAFIQWVSGWRVCFYFSS